MQVSLCNEVDLVMDVVAHCIRILVSGVMERLEASYKAMQVCYDNIHTCCLQRMNDYVSSL